MIGTIQPNWADRLALWFGRAAKAAPPEPAMLYSAPQPIPTYPIVFPGWEKLDRAANQDIARVKAALASPGVWSNTQAIANEFASASLIIKERKGNKLEDVDNHPLEVLWEQPNPHMGRSYLMRYWAMSYELFGKAYLFWATQGNEIAEVWPVPAFMLTPIPDDQEFIKGYAFKSRPDASPMVIDSKYITFSRSVNLFDPRDGLSFLASVMMSIETDRAAAEWNRNFFKEQNAVPDGLITVPKDTLDTDLARIREEIRAWFGGTKRGIGVARTGDMDYKAFGRSQKDAEFLSARQFEQKLIDRALGFPEGYWSERANRANAEQARATMIAGAVWPLLVTLHEDLNAQTIPVWYGEQYRAEFDDIRPEDRELKLKENESRKGYLVINELREADGYEPLPPDDPRGNLFVAEIGKGMTPGAEEEAEMSPDVASMPPAELPEEDSAVETTDTGAIEQVPADLPPADIAPDEAVTKALDDLARWQRKVKDGMKAGKRPATIRYTPECIDAETANDIRTALVDAETPDAVKSVFDQAFKAAKRRDDAVWQDAIAWARKALSDE